MSRLIGQILSAIALLVSLAASQTTSLDYCQLLVDVISICEIETASFTSLPLTDQASCLCGTTLGTLAWGPATFDGLASDCATQYATIQTAIAGDAAALEGFCTSYAPGAQSVLATPTSNTVLNTALNTQSIAPQTSATSTAPVYTDTGLYTTPATTVGPTAPATTVFSVVTIAQTTSSASSQNGAERKQPQELRSIVYTLVLEVLVLVAYL